MGDDKAPYEARSWTRSAAFCSRVVVQKAAQLGITDAAIVNSIGYFIDTDVCPIQVVQPAIRDG
jgi:phage terminase large subunit GpA-like protein